MASELGWGDEPIEIESAARAAICLNGLWRFAPYGMVKTPENWGVIRVPGSWKPWGFLPGVTKRGENWRGEIDRGWYERDLQIPDAWKGRRVLLDFRRVSTDAIVFVDGRLAGEVNWPGGQVDITAFCNFGQKQRLDVLVEASLIDKEVVRYMGPEAAQITRQKASLHHKGIIGDVVVRSQPAGAAVADLAIRTSTRNQELSLQFAVNGKPSQAVSVTARLYNQSGQLERVFRAQTSSDESSNVSVSWTWDHPTLWDIDNPHLYRLVMDVAGDGIKDELAREFGFREFWIDGRDFYLNGTPIRLRPTRHTSSYSNIEIISKQIAELKQSGFNTIEGVWGDYLSRGSHDDDYLWAREADRQGMLMIARAIDDGDIVSRQLTDKRMMAHWKSKAQKRLLDLINNPSVVMWVFAGNRFGIGQDQNPNIIGNRKRFAQNFSPWLTKHRSGFNAMEILRQIDPTRPSFSHAGSFVGDVYTINNYLCLIPLQEREDWLSDWAQHGDMPFMACEFGLPLEATFKRGRAGGIGPAQNSEPLFTEFAAAYLGPRAYRMEKDAYRNYILDSFKGDQQYGSDIFYDICWPAAVEVQDLFIRNTYRSWRTAGISGGMLPWGPRATTPKTFTGWDFKKHDWIRETVNPEWPWKPGRRGTYTSQIQRFLLQRYSSDLSSVEALIQNNSETLAWIAGEKETFTEKGHNFAPGQTVRKQVAMLNDTRHPQAYRWEANVFCSGKRVDTITKSGTINPGQTLLDELSFDLDRKLSVAKTGGHIALQATIASHTHRDSFSFNVINDPRPLDAAALAVVDHSGETVRMLKRGGWKVTPWQGEGELVVVGRRALERDGSILPKLKRHLEKGGRAIVMAQDPTWLETNVGWRVALYAPRRVFPVVSSPYWKTLDPDMLRDWRGGSTLVKPILGDIETITELLKAPTHGWRWGGQGSVSSCAVEKPHYGGWTPLLECEFDLAYTPLMQLQVGKGLLVYCGLDLEDHAAIDAAANLVLHKLVDYTRTAAIDARRETVFVGNDNDEMLLKAAGVVYRKSATLPAAPSLAIVSQDSAISDASLEAFVSAGGRVLVLPSRQAGAGKLGASIEKHNGFYGSLNVPDWPVCHGLSESDLRWRTTATAYAITGGCEIRADGLLGRKTIGAGEIIFCQLDPAVLDADHKTYMRYTRWRQTRALSQLLANLGASFKADEKLFDAAASRQSQKISLAGKWEARFVNPLPFVKAGAKPHPDPGISDVALSLVGVSSSAHGFESVAVPGDAQYYGPKWEANGEMVFRKEIDIPPAWAGKDLLLSLGPVDDFDSTFFNGEKIGQTDITVPKFWSLKRKYTIPAALVKPGRSVIAVRVFDHMGNGGFTGMPDDLFVIPAEYADKAETNVTDLFYHGDYRKDQKYGDDPYRYYRW